MDAIKYLIERERMCGMYECYECPMSEYADCVNIEAEYPKKAVEIVENWSRENTKAYPDCASCPIPDVNCYEQCKEQNNG